MSAVLRIGFVGPLPPPPGGMANQTRQLADLLAGQGVDVRIASTNAPYRPSWVGRVRGLRGLFRFVPFLAALRTLCGNVSLVHVMANSGWAWFLCAAPAVNAALRRGLPVVVHYHGGLAQSFLAKSAARVVPTLQRASAVVVPSTYLQKVFAEHGVESQVIPNGVNQDVFRLGPERLPDRQHVSVVVTRNLETVYGIDVAVRAAAQLRKEFPNLVMSIAGAGPQRDALAKLTAELHLENVIRFTGRLDVAQIAALYAQADVALNPSRADNAPTALLEAAACGVPIVSTNVGGVPYLVEHERTALLVPPDAPELMAAAVTRVLRDAALRRTLRENAAALADSCSWPAVTRQWLTLYERLTREHSTREAQVA
jgi:glycosyltransferase involved in cell wall biosynthesis